MTVKKLFMIVGLSLIIGCSMAARGSLVTKDGSARFESKTDAITLQAGPASVFDSDGSVLVIHVGVDDYVTDPTGKRR